MAAGKLSTISAREQYLCGALAVILSGYVFYAVAVEPQFLELRATQAKLDSQKRLVGEKRRLIAERTREEQTRTQVRKGNEEKITQFRKEVESLNSYIFRPGGASLFLASLDARAAASRCQLVSMEFLPQENLLPIPEEKKKETRPPEKKQSPSMAKPAEPAIAAPRPILKVPARVALRGKYADIIHLLEAIHGKSQKVQVAELRLEPVTGSDTELTATFILTVYAFEA